MAEEFPRGSRSDDGSKEPVTPGYLSSGGIKLNTLYPQLPVITSQPQEYRLQQIAEIKIFFEKEIETRRHIYLKYKKATGVLSYLNHSLNALSITAGVIGITSMVGVITGVAGIALTGVGMGGALLSSILNQINKKKVIIKVIKHEKIFTLAVSKLDTISDLVSRALSDGHITHEEFKLILNEKKKYLILKNNISMSYQKNIDNTNINIKFVSKIN